MEVGKKYYLGQPYGHDDPAMREKRYRFACILTAKLMERGFAVFSPIAHSHVLAQFISAEKRHDHNFWMDQDLPILKACDVLLVTALPGWDNSRGLADERAVAYDHGKEAVYPWDDDDFLYAYLGTLHEMAGLSV